MDYLLETIETEELVKAIASWATRNVVMIDQLAGERNNGLNHEYKASLRDLLRMTEELANRPDEYAAPLIKDIRDAIEDES